MPDHVVLLSVPGLRRQDLTHMPCLQALTSRGDAAELVASFPAVTCPCAGEHDDRPASQ